MFFLALALLQTVAADAPADETEVAGSGQSYSAATLQVIETLDPAEPQSSIASLEELGEAGDASALEALGELFGKGVSGIARDPDRACDYFEQVEAERGDTQHNIATCYYDGVGRPRDHVRARLHYRRAIAAGYTQARCALGNMLIRGQGGDIDVARVMALCREAAEAGIADAQADVGTYLLIGEHIERDPVAARSWLEQAGEQGQPNASYLLGQIYHKGDGVERDLDRAQSWFERAHASGRPDAAFQIFRMLFQRGYVSDAKRARIDPGVLEEAIEWARIAAETEPDPAHRKLAREAPEAIGRILAAARATD